MFGDPGGGWPLAAAAGPPGESTPATIDPVPGAWSHPGGPSPIGDRPNVTRSVPIQVVRRERPHGRSRRRVPRRLRQGRSRHSSGRSPPPTVAYPGAVPAAPPSLLEVADRVEGRLRNLVEAEQARWAALDPDLAAPLAALGRLLASGGKRLRPAFCHWGFVGRRRRARRHPLDRRRRRLRAAARLRAVPRRRHGRLGHPARLPHDPPELRRPAPGRGLDRARPGASARGSPSSSATWPSCTPTSCCTARPLRPGRSGPSCGSSSTSASTSTSSAPREASAAGSRRSASPGTRAASTRSSGRCTSAPCWPRPIGPTSCCPALSAYGLPLGDAFQLRDDVLGAFGETGVHGQAGRGRPARGQADTDDGHRHRPGHGRAGRGAGARGPVRAVRRGRRSRSSPCSSRRARWPRSRPTIDELAERGAAGTRRRRHHRRRPQGAGRSWPTTWPGGSSDRGLRGRGDNRSEPMKVVVVGAGLGGLAAAAHLVGRGHEVHGRRAVAAAGRSGRRGDRAGLRARQRPDGAHDARPARRTPSPLPGPTWPTS